MTTHARLPLLGIVSCLFFAGCLPPGYNLAGAGMPSSAPGGGSPSGSGPSSGSSGGSNATQAKSGEAPKAPQPMIPTTIEVRSECSKTVPVFFGEGKPGFSSGRKSSISSNSVSSEGRNIDGSLTIWLLDEHDNGTTNVKASPTSQRIVVDSSCKSLRVE